MIIIKEFNLGKKYYVYAWYYKNTGKVFYIGKGTKYRYRSRKRDNDKLVDIINHYECESKILKNYLSEKEAFEYEKEMIQTYRANGHPLINIQSGGHMPPNLKGSKRTIETKQKMSKSMIEYYKSHPEVGKMRSERMKKFLITPEVKEFLLKSFEAKNNDEFKKLQSIKCKKANQTKEYIEHQSQIAKEMWKSGKYAESHKGANNYQAQAVRQYDLNHNFICEYPTITEADNVTGINFRYISRAARGERKTSGGFIWEYVNDKKLKKPKKSFTYDVKKDKCAKQILQFDKNGQLISEYDSIAEATRKNNYPNRTNITQNLKGKTKSAYGYVWRYKHDNTMPSQ